MSAEAGGVPPAYDEAVAEKSPGERSVDVVAVVDASASMDEATTAAGAELAYSKLECAIQATKLMATVADRIAVVTYGEDAAVLLPTGEHTADAVQAAFDAENTRGSTNIEAGLRAAATQLHTDATRVQLVMVLTDGQPNRGVRTVEGLSAIAAGLPNAVVCTAGFGKGKSIDPVLLAAMAERGGGVFINIPDATSLGTGFASMVAAARAWGIAPPDLAAMPDPGVTDALADALSGLVERRDPFANLTTALQERLGPFRATVPGFAADLADEIVPGYTDAGKYETWGKAYLLAIALAYRRRVAITHFDKGLATFRNDHPIVARRYAQYSAVYDGMPAPVKRRVYDYHARAWRAPAVAAGSLSFATCASINNADEGCVDGDTPLVVDAVAGTTILAKDVVVGTRLIGGTVTHILYSEPNRDVVFSRLPNGTLITPWHPVSWGDKIVFPAQVPEFPAATKRCTKLVTFEIASDGTGAPSPFFLCGEDYGSHVAALALNAGIQDDPVATHPFWGTSKWRDTHPDPGPVYRHVGVKRSDPDAVHPQGQTTQWRAVAAS